jgi:hypothetical protein
MSVRSALLAMSLFGATGCGGCGDLLGLFGLDGLGAPFTHTIEGTLRLSFGVVEADCGGEGTRANDQGTVTYAHGPTADGNCGLGATWAGTLIDTTDAKEQVEAGMEDQGLDPETVNITFTKVTFAVGAVTFTDAAGNDLTPPSIPSYRGVLGVEGDDEVIVVTHEGDGDPTQPAIEVKESEALVEALNTSWDSGESVPGTGDASAVVDMESAAAFADADDPGLDIEYAVTVEATVGI